MKAIEQDTWDPAEWARELELRRLKEEEIERTRLRFAPVLADMFLSYSFLRQELGRRIIDIFDNPVLAKHLPGAVEDSIDLVGYHSNRDRYKISTEDDTCRVAFFSDGTVGVIYNPKPGTQEMQLASKVADIISEPEFVVNPHIFGIHFRRSDNRIEPFFVEDRAGSADGSTKSVKGVIGVAADVVDPLLKTINGLLAKGRIEPPSQGMRTNTSALARP